MKNKLSLLTGLALFSCFCILSASNRIISLLFSEHQSVGIITVEILAFFLPALVIKFCADRCDMPISFRLSFNSTVFKSISFILKFGLMISLLSFLANYTIYLITGFSEVKLSGLVPDAGGKSPAFGWLAFVAVAVIPAFVEEIFLRGAVFSAFETKLSTIACIFMTGLCFAMLHGTGNFAGPFLAGCGYAYLTYVFDSIWPAVLAHLVNNLYYVFINWLISIYGTFGIWAYFPQVNGIFFLLISYLTFHSLEKLLDRGYIRRFERTSSETITSLLGVLFNPGFIVFICAFLAKSVFKLF